MQGLKNNEIAEDLQISINTVKLQKKIAYSQLREKLKSPFFDFSPASLIFFLNLYTRFLSSVVLLANMNNK